MLSAAAKAATSGSPSTGAGHCPRASGGTSSSGRSHSPSTRPAIARSTSCAAATLAAIGASRIASASRRQTSTAVGGGSVSSVRSDNVAGGRLLARHLVECGCRRIAFIAGNEESSTNLERERGFREGLAEAGQHIWARATGNYDFEQAKMAARQIFSTAGERPDAVFVASDHMAFAVMDTLRGELGLRVPGDVAVVGYDNVPQADWGAYRLTTVEQPVVPMIEATVRLLQQHIGRGSRHEVENVVVPVQLMVRESTGKPAARPTRARGASRRAG